MNSSYNALPSVQKITSTLAVDNVQKTSTSKSVSQVGETFASILDGLSQTEQTSDNLLAQLAAGEDVNIHEVMIAAEETDTNFRIAMSIRDKLVDAYNEIMRMQV